MKKFLVLAVLAFCSSVYAQYPPLNSHYQLVFADEFNYPDSVKVDSLAKRWNSIWPWNQSSIMQGCLPDKYGKPMPVPVRKIGYRTWNFHNCELDTGVLRIVSRKENYAGEVWNGWDCLQTDSLGKCLKYKQRDSIVNFSYTTGMLLSKSKFRYGYFEIRCKLPKPRKPHASRGIGPNFWLYGADSTSVSSEIDVFEFAGEYEGRPNVQTSNVHYQHKNAADCKDCKPEDVKHYSEVKDYGTCDFKDFHTFGVEWRPDTILFYKDGHVIHSSHNHPDKLVAMNIIIDINHPASNFCSFTDKFTKFPYVYQIDYVRVYQLKEPEQKEDMRPVPIQSNSSK